MKDLVKFKQYLLALSDAVNSFASERVQVNVISRVIAAFQDHGDLGIENHEVAFIQGSTPFPLDTSPFIVEKATVRQPGLTKFIKEEMNGGYFNTARTLAGITAYLAEKHQTQYYTYQTSGILLGLVNKGKLKRDTDPVAGGYIYLLPTE
jgi:hypothetical protein